MSEPEEFFARIEMPHRRINPCFMTGKQCVLAEAIDSEICSRRSRGSYTGFMIVPFRPNISTFFHLCFNRFVRESYVPDRGERGPADTLELLRGDQVWQTGYVICEKVCRKIQDSDFVIADISTPNANVFYELGLAFGANQKIVVIYHKDSQFGRRTAHFLERGGCRAYAYEDLNPLSCTRFPLSQHIWQRESMASERLPSKPKVLFYERLRGDDAIDVDPPRDVEEDIRLDFKMHLIAAVSVAMSNLALRIRASKGGTLAWYYDNMIRQMNAAICVDRNDPFDAIESQMQESFCTIIRTGRNCEPMAYFWLGYCHALGKNVIPITVMAQAADGITDLAFDLRALWHMTFSWDRADQFAPELEEILYHIFMTSFAECFRREFWDQVLTRSGTVSIFAGALHNAEFGREMIGDWDLRTASELTSFFAMHQYGAVIESPVYQIELVGSGSTASREDYIGGLERLIEDKNCVIIGSADVNPLTELVLGRVYGIPEKYWFTDQEYAQRPGHLVVTVKQVPKGPAGAAAEASYHPRITRFFYKERPVDSSKNATLCQGYEAGYLMREGVMGEFASQLEPVTQFIAYGHLLIAVNPFCHGGVTPLKFVIVLNGVTGPATFGLMRALTGSGASTEFEAYDSGFDPEGECEGVLRQVLQEWDVARESGRECLQCILAIRVGGAVSNLSEERPTTRGPIGIFDWRRTKGWELLTQTLHAFHAQGSTKGQSRSR